MGVTLSGFDRRATNLIRALEDHGWVFEVSSKGHAVGKAPDGVTTCAIGRKLSRADRSQQNAESVLKRWERAIRCAEQA